jgi:hypothetical protein
MKAAIGHFPTWCGGCGVAWIATEDPGHRCATCPACLAWVAQQTAAEKRRKKKREAAQ